MVIINIFTVYMPSKQKVIVAVFFKLNENKEESIKIIYLHLFTIKVVYFWHFYDEKN